MQDDTNQTLLEVGDTYTHTFSFTQAQVIEFANLTGDKNPLHLDAEYAATTVFKKPIIHGLFGMSVFSKIMGMEFPGEGSIYMSHSLEFKRPMYVEVSYEAIFTVAEIDRKRHTAIVNTQVFNSQTKKITIDGHSKVMNKLVL